MTDDDPGDAQPDAPTEPLGQHLVDLARSRQEMQRTADAIARMLAAEGERQRKAEP